MILLILSISSTYLIVNSYIIVVLLNDWECESTDPQHRYQLTPSQLENLCVDIQNRLNSVISSPDKGFTHRSLSFLYFFFPSSFMLLIILIITIYYNYDKIGTTGMKSNPLSRSNSPSQSIIKSIRSPIPTPTAEILDCVGYNFLFSFFALVFYYFYL